MKRNHSGHIHMVLALVLVALVIGAAGWFVYQRNQPSKVNDPAVKAQLQQTSSELKKINLAQIKQTADSVSSVQTSFNYQKANGK